MIVDGKSLADEILAKLKIPKLPRRLSVGAILVGKSAASESFLKQKAKTAEFLDISFKVFKFNHKIKTEELKKKIFKLNKSKNIIGIIIQLPLPKQIKVGEILSVINPKKDIDALSKNPKVLAPTVEAVKFIFKKYKINLKNKNFLIVGRGRLVGRPIYSWLAMQLKVKTRINIIDVKQKNQLPKLARWADVIISGVGKAGLIKGSMIKKGSVLIDFGFSKKDEKISGDFDFASCAKKAKLITPVPGGMGPVMVAMLFKNLIKLNKNPT